MRKKSLVLAAILAAGVMAGCGQQTQPAQIAPDSGTASVSGSSEEVAAAEEETETAAKETDAPEPEKPAEQESTKALKQAFADHDNSAGMIYHLNEKARQRERSGWSSNLTAQEEQEVLDSMNERFKEAVLKKAWENLEHADVWDYEEIVLREIAGKDIFPKEEMDAYLLARALYADNLAAKALRAGGRDSLRRCIRRRDGKDRNGTEQFHGSTGGGGRCRGRCPGRICGYAGAHRISGAGKLQYGGIQRDPGESLQIRHGISPVHFLH